MAKKFNELTAASALTGVEIFPLDQSGETRRATLNQVATFIGAAAQTVFSSAGDPNSVVTATGPALCVQTKLTGGGNHGLWVKPTGSTGNTGWQELIAAA